CSCPRSPCGLRVSERIARPGGEAIATGWAVTFVTDLRAGEVLVAGTDAAAHHGLELQPARLAPLPGAHPLLTSSVCSEGDVAPESRPQGLPRRLADGVARQS